MEKLLHLIPNMDENCLKESLVIPRAGARGERVNNIHAVKGTCFRKILSANPFLRGINIFLFLMTKMFYELNLLFTKQV